MGRRNKGKAKQANKERQAAVAKQQQEALEAQIEQLQIDIDDNFLQQPEDNNVVIEKCKHGYEVIPEGSYLHQFRNDFFDTFHHASDGDGPECMPAALLAALNATVNKYLGVWKKVEMIERIISSLLFSGTQSILDGNIEQAHESAVFVSFFEDYNAIMRRTQASFNWPKMSELALDERTLVGFLRKRIPCTCLDEKYNAVKHMTKMGFCSNPQCVLRDGKVERSATNYCAECRCVTYCSQGCQKDDWPRHKCYCSLFAMRRASFDATQTQK